MMNNNIKNTLAILLSSALLVPMCACAVVEGADAETAQSFFEQYNENHPEFDGNFDGNDIIWETPDGQEPDGGSSASGSVSGSSELDTSDLFTERDQTQTADLSEAVSITLTDGSDVTISKEGVYVITGTANEATVIVDADSKDKVQLVLSGVSVTNTDSPVIYVKNADKVFVTSAEGSTNTLVVSGSFTADGETNTDAVIFSKDDVVLNGLGTVNISSTDNGVTSKDDLKITGGTWSIYCTSDALEANDSIVMSGGTVNISTKKDGFHAENDEDNTAGYVYISGGTVKIIASDDGIHATTVCQIDGGSFEITAAEGIEATVVRINDGIINISASDDGINASSKSKAYSPLVEFNGGTTTIVMGQGDTDGVDSNGDIIVNGGTIDVTGQSTFDYSGTATYNGGTIIVNGSQTDTIPNQFMGGGMGGRGGMGGGQDGFGGQTPPDGGQGGFGGQTPPDGGQGGRGGRGGRRG